MQSTDDSVLLRQYAENNSDDAFAALVTRHINLVYSVALRQVGDPHQAEEITQAVFIILAKKVAQLRHDKALSSWLFQATRLTANNFVRSETRRHRREQEAQMQSVLNETGEETWQKISPLLDTAVAGLGEKDRQAVVLRFYEGKNLREVGAVLGASEAAAEKRVSRALDKLRKFFAKRGVVSTTAIIAGAISANSVQAAPGELATSISAAAITKGAAVSSSTLTLIQGALRIMAWTKVKTGIIAGIAVVLAATTVTLVHSQRGGFSSSYYTEKGWELRNAGKMDEAAAMFGKAITLDPKNADAWNGHGWTAFDLRQPQEAEKDFQTAISLNAGQWAAMNGLGHLYLSQRKYDDAEMWFLKAAPQAPGAAFGLARLYLLQEKFAEAEKWARQLVNAGHFPNTSPGLLQAAQSKHLSDELRAKLEPK